MLGNQFALDLNSEIFVDCFAGGGGASTGIELAIGRHVDVALNHNRKAVAMHRMNHPQTRHYIEDIRKADPIAVTGGRPVAGLWMSPDCTHHSRARGGKPRNKKIRGLAWTIVSWINRLRPLHTAPRVIWLENVAEFTTWCPLLPGGTGLNPWRTGWFFKCFTGALYRRGYHDIQWAPGDGNVYRRTASGIEQVPDVHFSSRAADYSAPTIRTRLFLIAGRDCQPIVWPKPSHAEPEAVATAKKRIKARASKDTALKPHRMIAECLDFNLPCPSIFLSKEEGRKVNAKRPLAPATMRRLAKGVDRYVLKTKRPFLVSLTHQGGDRCESIDDPAKTITSANRGEKAFVAPVIAYAQQGGRSRPATAPIHTITASPKDQNQVIQPVLVRAGAAAIETPSGTTVSAMHLTKFRTGSVGCGIDEPSPTITANSFVKRPGGAVPLGLVAASIVKMRGDAASHAPGHSADEPIHTISAEGTHHAVMAAYLAQHNGGANGHQTIGHAATEPASTISSKGSQQQLVAASLIKYYGTDQDPRIDEPGHTVTTKDRFGMIEATLECPPLTEEQMQGARRVAQFLRDHGVEFEGEFANVDGYVVVDIGMRMLKPRELYLAQGFPPSYIIDRGLDVDELGTLKEIQLTNTDQVRMCGNSVSPPIAQAIVAANLPDLRRVRMAA